MKRKELELLNHVISYGSVSDAARALHMTQPNASKMLKKIEERFGFQLFERINGRLHATAEGRLIAEQAETTLVSMRRFDSLTRRIRDMHHGSLTLGALPLLSWRWLPTVLADFMEKYPEVYTSLHTRSSRKLIELVAERQIDLAVGMLTMDDPLVECRKLADLDMVAAVPASHPLAARETIRVVDYHQQNFITTSSLDHSRERIADYFAHYGVEPRDRCECSLPDVALNLVSRGLGLALVSHVSATQHRREGVVFRPLETGLQITIWTIRPRLRPKSRLVDSFESLLMARAADGSLDNPFTARAPSIPLQGTAP